MSTSRALLICEGSCDGVVEHGFVERRWARAKTIEVVYVCLGCGRSRRWGLELLDDAAVAA